MDIDRFLCFTEPIHFHTVSCCLLLSISLGKIQFPLIRKKSAGTGFSYFSRSGSLILPESLLRNYFYLQFVLFRILFFPAARSLRPPKTAEDRKPVQKFSTYSAFFSPLFHLLRHIFPYYPMTFPHTDIPFRPVLPSLVFYGMLLYNGKKIRGLVSALQEACSRVSSKAFTTLR